MEGENTQQNQKPQQVEAQKVQEASLQNSNTTEIKSQEKQDKNINKVAQQLPQVQQTKNQTCENEKVQNQTEEKTEQSQAQKQENVKQETVETNQTQDKNSETQKKTENQEGQITKSVPVIKVQIETTTVHVQLEAPKQSEPIRQQQKKQETVTKEQEKVIQQKIQQKAQQKVMQKIQEKAPKIQEIVIVKQQKSGLDWELQKITFTIFDELKALQHSQKWQKYNDKPCPMYKIEIESRIATKGVGVVNFSYQKVVEFLSDQSTLMALNPTCVDCRVLHKKAKPGDKEDIFRVNYMQYKAVWPVANRQFINVGAKKSEGQHKYYIGTKKCDYPYPQDKKIVRGQCYIGGYIIQRIDEKSTKVTYISDADIKGSIPGMVKNMLAKSQGEVAAKIQGVMKQAEKKKKK